MLTEKDLKHITAHGLTVKEIIKQIDTYRKGIPYVNLITAASIGNGIEVIPKNAEEKLIALYEDKMASLDIVKFVPASGAATRMFRFLQEFLNNYDPNEETIRAYLKRTNDKELELFLDSLKLFPFVNDVRRVIRENHSDYKKSKKGPRCKMFISSMLFEQGLNYANLPKGLIPFHRYKKYSTTAFEEQLYEAAFYASATDSVYLHFTFSEEHVDFFKQEFEAIKNRVSAKTKKEFHISYSFQKKETDSISFTVYKEPLRDDKNNLVFRPSGHGALLSNLNDVDADIIFIKNIDNVVIEPYVEHIANYKKLLAGKLLFLQSKVFNYINKINDEVITPELYNELKSFFWNELSLKDVPFNKKQILNLLDRPIRVCGVVQNTGAPGGGPFWVKDQQGRTSLQIVEISQIDKLDDRQMNVVSEATHFNPVDIVCSVRNHKGEKYDLERYADPKSGFISVKSHKGELINALERPGLWNGGMANWNTAFVEVPLSTFNPVKTVNDLLKKEHRPDA